MIPVVTLLGVSSIDNNISFNLTNKITTRTTIDTTRTRNLFKNIVRVITYNVNTEELYE